MTLEELEARRNAAIAKRQEYEAILGSKNRTDRQGNRIGSHTYWVERNRVTLELAKVCGELRSLNLQIKQKRAEVHVANEALKVGLSPDVPLIELFEALYKMARRFAQDLREEGAAVEADELALLNLCEGRIRKLRK
jgi:hypothetical protein